MTDPIQQTMVDAKLNAIALTRAALTHDDAALHVLLASMDLDEARDTIGNLLSLSASLLTTVTHHPVAILDQWARDVIADAG